MGKLITVADALYDVAFAVSVVEAAEINKLYDYLGRVPDNPSIKRISKSPNCFVINFSDLKDKWSPEYHDNLWQARYLQEKLQTCSHWDSFAKIIQQVIEKGSLPEGEAGYVYRVYFNDQVREYLRNYGADAQ